MRFLDSPMVLLIRREIMERVRTKGYQATTALLVLSAVLGVALPTLIGGDDDAPGLDIAVTSQVDDQTRALVTNLALVDAQDRKVEIEVVPAATDEAGNALVRDGDADLLVTPDALVVEEGNDGTTTAQALATISEAVRLRSGLAEVGVTGDEATTVIEAPGPELRQIAGTGYDSSDQALFPLALTGSILLYMLLIFYGQLVSGGVNEEKSSRVVELLLATVSPVRMLTAKVTGIGLVGLFQVGAAAVGAAVAAVVVGAELPPGSVPTVAAYLMWFVLGYALYCSLFAAAGALTSRSEDAQQAASPLYLLLGVGYGTAFAAIDSPDGTFATVLSFVPFTAPMVMPARAALGTLAPWELGLSIALCLGLTAATLALAARVYAGALLRFGSRVKVREALRSS